MAQQETARKTANLYNSENDVGSVYPTYPINNSMAFEVKHADQDVQGTAHSAKIIRDETFRIVDMSYQTADMLVRA